MFGQIISRSDYWQNLTPDSLSLIIQGHISDSKTKENLVFVKVIWHSYETMSDLNGNYKLKIPIYLIKESNADTVSINYKYSCYCFPVKKIRTKKLIQIINVKGKICCVELKADPNVGEAVKLIEK
jgi:hypothetical protein